MWIFAFLKPYTNVAANAEYKKFRDNPEWSVF